MAQKLRKPPHFLQEWLDHLKLTQEQFGERVGLGASAVSKICTGLKPIVQNRLPKFAEALGIAIPDLYGPPPSRPVFTEGRSIMPPLNDQDQTRLALASLAAGIVRTLEKRWPGVQKEVESEIQVIYQNLRESGDGNLQTLEALRWFSESLRMK